MHPKQLEEHSLPFFEHSKVFKRNNEFAIVNSYYHDKNLGIPLLMHRHSFFEINVITKGNGYHYIENQCIEAKLGSVYVIPPNIRHGYYADDIDNFEIFHIILSNEFMYRYKRELESMEGFNTLFKIEPQLRSSLSESVFLKLDKKKFKEAKKDFDKMKELSDLKNPSSDIALIGMALYIISFFSTTIMEMHDMERNSADTSSSKKIDAINIIKTMEYIQKNYGEKLTIDSLSKYAEMSRSIFIRQFELFTKQTINEYITDIRIEAACELLKEGNLSISSVAQECGFFDSSHFSKTFLMKKGVSPLSYKNSTSK